MAHVLPKGLEGCQKAVDALAALTAADAAKAECWADWTKRRDEYETRWKDVGPTLTHEAQDAMADYVKAWSAAGEAKMLADMVYVRARIYYKMVIGDHKSGRHEECRTESTGE